ncbi:putative calcium calmodulin-dependent protein kinase type 1b protein [Ilyonectria robusta]
MECDILACLDRAFARKTVGAGEEWCVIEAHDYEIGIIEQMLNTRQISKQPYNIRKAGEATGADHPIPGGDNLASGIIIGSSANTNESGLRGGSVARGSCTCMRLATYGTAHVWLEECFTVSSQQEPRLRAVKEIRKHHSVPTSAFHRELEAIAKFSHDKFADCFVRSFGWFQNETALFITMEYLEHGDLRHYIVRPFPEPEARLIAMQLVEALQSMHKSGFAHRDLKPGNILVVHRGPRWWVKICDFGISKRVEGSTALRTMEVGTMGYMAPEVLGMFTLEDLQENQTEVAAYTSAVDLWALGEITHKLLTQKATFLSPNQRANYVTMGTQFPTNELESVGASTHCILFIQQTMAASPRKRLTADEAAGHE